MIICSKGHPFVLLWLSSYLDDYRASWAYNTGKLPDKLIKRHPNLVHIEETKLFYPNYYELDKIIGEGVYYDWTEQYTIHLWYRMWKDYSKEEPNPINIKLWNNTFGQLSRRALYGTANLIYN